MSCTETIRAGRPAASLPGAPATAPRPGIQAGPHGRLTDDPGPGSARAAPWGAGRPSRPRAAPTRTKFRCPTEPAHRAGATLPTRRTGATLED